MNESRSANNMLQRACPGKFGIPMIRVQGCEKGMLATLKKYFPLFCRKCTMKMKMIWGKY